jgi:hypothetical protein
MKDKSTESPKVRQSAPATQNETKPERKPPTIRTIGVKKGEVKNTPAPIVTKTTVALLTILFSIASVFAASPSIRSVTENVYTTRLLWNLSASAITNRIVRASTGNYYGDTNTSQLNIRTNGSGRWEWRNGATVLATNTVNRVYGTWRTNGTGAAIYGYTRYEPSPTTQLATDAIGNVVDPVSPALQSLLSSRSVYVAKNGNTNWPGTMLYPKSAITNGVNAASAGDTVFVHGGTYYEHDILRTNVHLFGYPGADVVFLQSTNSPPWSIVDDRRLLGGTTNNIVWHGDFKFLGSTNGHAEFGAYLYNDGSRGAVCITNPNTVLNLKFNNIIVRDISGYQSTAGITVLNARRVDIEGNGILSPNYADGVESGAITVVDSEFGTADMNELAMGIWWEHGEIFSRVRSIKVNNYSIWPEGRDENTSAVDGWFEGDFLGSKIYINAGTNANYRSWFKYKELMTFGAGSPALSIYGGGKHYFEIPKIKGGPGSTAIEIASQAGGANASSSENYITTQKLESDTKYVLFSATNATLRLNTMNFVGYYGGEGFTMNGTSRLFPNYSQGGRTNVTAAASLSINIVPPLPTTNFIFTISGPAITNYTILTQTRSNVLAVFPTTTSVIHWRADLNSQ